MTTIQTHVPTCMCETCERRDGGDCAVRAFSEGDVTALARLSDAVARALPALRAPASESDLTETSQRRDTA